MSDRSDELPPASDQAPDAHSEALARYLADESSPAEAADVRAWLDAHPQDASFDAIVRARSGRLEQRADVSVNTERALAAVRARMAREDATVAPAAQAPLRVERGGAPRLTPTATPRRSWRWVGFAAAAGLAAVAALSQFRSTSSGTGQEAQEYQTRVGQRDSVRLPDGSTVVLAPGSRLTVAADFGETTREVTLDGAAYFDVQHDATHPFTVHTADADIRDIGTAFSVKTSGNGEVAVDVTHGIVALSARAAADTPTELRAGDRGVVARQAVTVSRGTVTADDVAWTRGVLSYRDASLSEVRADLLRWYGLDLRVVDSALARRTLTASFRGDSAAQVVRVIALALGAEVVQQGDTVTLQPQGSVPTPTP
jgi:transmembrane sensor